jgi:pimeloyl-ACP methyl ester carboxylesterase
MIAGRRARSSLWRVGALAGLIVAAGAVVLGVRAWQGRGDPCGQGRCVFVKVPENRAVPAGRTIQIRTLVLSATGGTPRADPVFFLAGGPGQPSSDLARGQAGSPLRATRDLVFVDQRGTGGSNPLHCDFYRAGDQSTGRLPDFLPIDRVRECRRALERIADLTQYTTAAAVEDLEAVRAQLGYERINLAGGSYGTRLALEYARRYPARVRTLVLDGAVSPSVAMPAGFGVAAQRALDGVLDECAADAACTAAYPRVRAQAGELFARLARTPLEARTPAGERVTLTRDHVAEVIRYMTYTTGGASRVPAVVARAHAGDGTGVLGELQRQRDGSGLGGLYLSVTCAEDVPFADPTLVAADRETYLSYYRYRQQKAACDEWPRGAVPETHRTPVRSDVPALLVTGALDPATPPALADEIAATLPNSRVVKVPSGGHGLNGLDGLGCVHALRVRFIEQGHARDLDTSCMSSVRRGRFQ